MRGTFDKLLNGWTWATIPRSVNFYDGEGEGDGDDSGGDDGDNNNPLQDMLDNGDKGKDGEGDGGDDDWLERATKLGVDKEHVGKTPDETVKNLQDRIKGFRDKIAKGDKGSKGAEVPESHEGYEIEPADESDIVAPYLNAEENKPIFEHFQKSALEHGMDKSQFAGFMRDGLSAAHEAGMIDLRDDATQVAESGKSEMEALEKSVGAGPAIDMTNSVINYGKSLVEDGTIPKEFLNEFNIMAGTAEGTQIMYAILSGKKGMKPMPHGDPVKGAMTTQDANDKYQTALAMKAGGARDAAIREAEADLKKSYAHLGQGNSVPLDMG